MPVSFQGSRLTRLAFQGSEQGSQTRATPQGDHPQGLVGVEIGRTGHGVVGGPGLSGLR